MDINKINNLHEAKLSSSKRIDRDNGFSEIFNRKLAATNPINPSGPVDARMEVLSQGDKILNLMEDYAKALNDPARTLKEIEPLVNTIEKEIGSLESKTVDKVRDDTELDNFIKDLAVTVNVAAFKFHRGDYI